MGEALIGDRIAILSGVLGFLLLIAHSGVRPGPASYGWLDEPQRSQRIRTAKRRAVAVLVAGGLCMLVFAYAVLFLPMASG